MHHKTRALSPIRLIVTLAAAVFVAEALVMIGLAMFPGIPHPIADILDAAILLVLLAPVLYVFVFRPVTQTVHQLISVDEMRQANEARLRAMLNNLPYQAWLKDADGRYLAVNEQFAQACGMESAAEVAGKTAEEAGPEWMRDPHYADYHLVMGSGRQAHTEMKVREHGEDRWLEVFRNPVLDNNGRVIGIAGFSRDITQRKQVEEELRLTAKIFENSHDAIVITDAEASIISVNPAFSEMTGYSQDEVAGKNMRMLRSGRHGKDFYAEMWETLLTTGYWNGEVWNQRKDGTSYAGRLSITTLRDQSGKPTHYVGTTSDITEYKMAQERVRHLAYYDQLTGLPNGQLMRDRATQLISSSQKEGREFSLLFMDLDNFKNVNDSLGHHVGDLLLQTIAGRLHTAVREIDTVARLGGDEFVVLLADMGADDAQRVARKIIGQVTASFGVELHTITMTTSMGISVFPRDGATIDALLKNAELALYQAKAKGRNDFAFFAEKMNVLALERMEIESGLRRALLNEELLLYFQPQISLTTGKMVAAEALVRWPLPTLEMVPPDQFIPISEESDIIIELGEWTMHEACRQVREWQRLGLQTVPVSVNVSAKQMKDADFPDRVSSVLRKTGLDARYLELELTERAVMEEMEKTVDMMNRIGKLGVKFAVDDFGTGYSSLSYLRHLPLDKLKIDKSFVQDLAADESDREISNTVIQLAHGLQLSVVAEGVETQQQRDILLGQGCDCGQGYLFGAPMPPHEFASHLQPAQAS